MHYYVAGFVVLLLVAQGCACGKCVNIMYWPGQAELSALVAKLITLRFSVNSVFGSSSSSPNHISHHLFVYGRRISQLNESVHGK